MQGQSEIVTEKKQRGVSFALEINAAVLRKHLWMSYHHIDINSGSGENHIVGCVGTPITAILSLPDNVAFTFVDHNIKQCEALAAHPLVIKNSHRCEIVCQDNGAYLYETLLRTSDYKKRGSILVDPEGYDIPLEALQEVMQRYPKMDLILHLNATSTKRGLTKAIRLSQMLDMMNKTNWQLRLPLSMHQFTLAIGRNFKGGDYRAQGFFHGTSPEGRAIEEYLSVAKADCSPGSRDLVERLITQYKEREAQRLRPALRQLKFFNQGL